MDNKTGDYFLFPVRLLLLTLSVGDVNKFYHLLCVGVCYNQGKRKLNRFVLFCSSVVLFFLLLVFLAFP